jgi:threonine synthase
MLFFSTARKTEPVSFRTAVFEGMPGDGGLFMPQVLPVLPREQIERFRDTTLQEISAEVAASFLKDEIPQAHLFQLVHNSISFDAPLVQLDDKFFILELFHGPTLAFKDFGARFLASVIGYWTRNSDREIVVLVATSGDTGSAVANGFYKVPGIKVVLLYPSGMVSKIQEQQLTTLGANVFALEVEGKFDDCQRLVKQAFSDSDLRRARQITSANSINIARWLPQSFYYFYAAARLSSTEGPLVFSVPSGNFGNLTAGLLAKKMGASIDQFIAATNRNDVVPNFLQTGKFSPREAIPTISNAMDVGNPSNFARLLALYDNDVDAVRRDIQGISITDEQTTNGITEVFRKFGYVLDPHSAVGYLGARLGITTENARAVILATAHPAKFPEIVERVTNQPIEPPESLKKALSLRKQSRIMRNNYDDLKSFLLTL